VAGKEKVFVDESHGSDETGQGTPSAPYKTTVQAGLKHGGLDQILIMIKKDAESEYAEITKSGLKKLHKTLDGIRRREARAAAATSSASTAKEEVEPDIVEDASLPKAEKIKIRQAGGKRGTRVVVRGWVASVRAQSRQLVFIDLRDGSDLYLQCVLTKNLVPIILVRRC
jgi:asparaginyl-tRNA synthetase